MELLRERGDRVQQAFNTANEFDGPAGTPDRKIDANGSPTHGASFSATSHKQLFEPALDLTPTEFDTEVTVDQGNNNKLIINDSDASPTAPAAILFPGDYGVVMPFTRIVAPSATSGRAGLIFGYKSSDDYWLFVIDFALTSANASYIHVTNGGATEDIIHTTTLNPNGSGEYTLNLMATANALNTLSSGTDLSTLGGFPAGRIGLYTEVPSETRYDYFLSNDGQFTRELSSAWSSQARNLISSNAGEGVLRINGFWEGTALPVLLESVRAKRFAVTFSVTRPTGTAESRGMLVLGQRGETDYAVIQIKHNATNIEGAEVIEGKPLSYLTALKPNTPPAVAANEKLWYRVICNGTDVFVHAIESSTEPASSAWGTTNLVWRTDNTTDRFDFTAEGGGRIGFLSQGYVMYIDDVTVQADRDANGSYETTDHIDRFDLNTTGDVEEDLEHDAAGNLTFDGNLAYTYDAFNRLISVRKAYRDDTGTLRLASLLKIYTYDGIHRRITEKAYNSGPFDEEYGYTYGYDGQRRVAEFISDDPVIRTRSYVWGLDYVDELIETVVRVANMDLGIGEMYERFYAVHDLKYCVLGLVDENGDWAERYEFTPDGKRQVYIPAGLNDPDAFTPVSEAPRVTRTQTFAQFTFIYRQTYALGNIGFQGLFHDEVTGNLYQRAREYHPRLARFHQRDPLGYPDGMNTYAAYHVMRGGMDPSGLNIFGIEWNVESDSKLEILGKRLYKRIKHRLYHSSNSYARILGPANKSTHYQEADFLVSLQTNYTINAGLAGRTGPPVIRGGPAPAGDGSLLTVRYSTQRYVKPTSKVLAPVIRGNQGNQGLYGKLCKKRMYIKQSCCPTNKHNRVGPQFLWDEFTYVNYIAVDLYGKTEKHRIVDVLQCNVSVAEQQLEQRLQVLNDPKISFDTCNDDLSFDNDSHLKAYKKSKKKPEGLIDYMKGSSDGIILYGRGYYISNPSE